MILRVAFLATCLLAFGLRWYRLDYHYLGLDESLSVETALLPLSQLVAFQQAKVFSHPPLHHTLLSLWLPLAGTSELAARFLSLFSGVAAVAAAMATARALVGRAGGLVVGLLMAVSPFAVYYGQEARMYTLVSLLALLAGYGLWRFHRSRRRRWLALAGAGLGLGLFSHYYYFFFAAALGLFLLSRLGSLRPHLRLLLPVLVLAALPALVWLGLARGTQASLAAVAGNDVHTPPDQVIADTLATFAGGPLWVRPAEPAAALASGVLLTLGLVQIVRWLPASGRGRERALLLLPWLLVPPLLGSLVPWSVYPRYLTVAYPAFLMVGSVALLALTGRRPLLLAGAAGLLALLSLGRTWDLFDSQRDLKSGFADAAREMNSQASPEDMVLLAGPAGRTLLAYYYRGAAPTQEITIDAPVWDRPALERSLERVTAVYPRIWLVVYAPQPQEEFVRGWFAGNAYELSNDFHSDTILASYVGGQGTPQSRVTDISFDGLLQLAAYQVGLVQDGGRRFVTHRADWRLLRAGGALAVSTRLVDQDGRLWADYDWWLPLQGEAGAVLRQNKALQLPAEAPAGAYRLQVVVYERDSERSLPARWEGRTREIVELATVQAGPGA